MGNNNNESFLSFLSFLSITTTTEEEHEVLSFLVATAAVSVLVSLASWDPPGRGLFLDNDMNEAVVQESLVLLSFVSKQAYSSNFLWKLFFPSFNRIIEVSTFNSLSESRVSSVIRCHTVFCSRSLKFKALGALHLVFTPKAGAVQ